MTWRRWFRRKHTDVQLNAEIKDHLERLTEDYVRSGLRESEARRRALLEFGGAERIKESCRDVRPRRWLDELRRDLLYATRVLRKAPGFTAAAVLSLGLGIGANTAILALLDQVLLRPLPVHRPQELALVRIDGVFNGTTWSDGEELSYPMYAEFRDHNAVFSGMAARFSVVLHVGDGRETERVEGEAVSGTYFDVLGLRPERGRLLTPDDDRAPQGQAVVVLSHRYWVRRFAADPAIVDRVISINNQPYTVAGVAQEGFAGLSVGRAVDVFLPLAKQADLEPGWRMLENRRVRWIHVFGRLRPGVTVAQAEASLEPFFQGQRQRELTEPYFNGASAEILGAFRAAKLQVQPGARGISSLRRTLTRPLWMLTALVIGLLLIACANVAGLLIARGSARQREIAIRLALGGSRARVIRQLLVESSLIAAAGAAAGLALSVWGTPILLRLLVEPEVASAFVAAPDLRILTMTLAIVTATAIVFGLAPAWQVTRPALAPTLKDETTTVAGGRSILLRKGLVVAQVALSLLLLVGAGLFVRSLRNLLLEDPGFRTTNLMSFSSNARLSGYDRVRAQEFYQRLVDRTSGLPGVTHVALATLPLLTGVSTSSTITVEGYEAQPGEEVMAHFNHITPGYFATIGVPILAGRDFNDRDMRTDPPPPGTSPYRVAIVNRRFVEKYLAGAPPLGRHVGMGGRAKPIIEIVGVVGDARHRALREPVEPQLFFAMREYPGLGAATAYIRTTQPPATMTAALRRVVQEIDPGVPVFRMRSMEEQVGRSVANERLLAHLSTVFGLLATLLAVVGLYGVTAYLVSQRRREIAVRLALGARTVDVTWLFLRDALGLVTIGCALAAPLLWLGGRYVESQLFGVAAADPATLAVAVLGLGAVAAAGALIPTLRGTRLQPLKVLREQ